LNIEPDDWDDWTAHPLTEALMRACELWAEEARQQWIAASWEAGKADPVLLASMRERARVFQELREITRETLERAE
jgi:hypothetical protein